MKTYKKFIAVLLTIAMVLSISVSGGTGVYAADSADNPIELSIGGVLEILKYLAGLPSDYDDSDKKPTIDDAVEILKHLAGLPSVHNDLTEPISSSKTNVDFKAEAISGVGWNGENIWETDMAVIYTLAEFRELLPPHRCLVGAPNCRQCVYYLRYNEKFFKEKYLLTFAFSSPSGGDKFEVERIGVNGNIYLKQTQFGVIDVVGYHSFVVELNKGFRPNKFKGSPLF